MEELMEMRELLAAGRYPEALELLTDIEEMGKHGLVSTIDSYVQRLLMPLIKRHAERRTTHSWEVSIRSSIYEIDKLNRRPKGRGFYVSPDELHDIIAATYGSALAKASLEAFEGQFHESKLETMIDSEAVRAEAMELLLASQRN